MQPTVLDLIATGVFALAILHTFAAKQLERVASRSPRHAGIFHLLSEVEVVFGFWAIVLMAVLAVFQGADEVVTYVESRNYSEPLFVFAIMVVAASRPIVSAVANVIDTLSRWLPLPIALAQAWLGLAAVPLLGSLITEPAAMTIAALLLAPIAFRRDIPEPRKYLAIGVLFVNISIGGTLSSYAAPPILMVAETWGWTTSFMLATFGWKAALAVALNATIAVVVLRRHLSRVQPRERAIEAVPMPIVMLHFALLAGIVIFAHHPVIFIGLLLMFLGIAHAYERHQNPLILREALLVGFFLAGLVVLGGLQRWWLQPVIGSLDDLQLFVGALSLTAITDNAALTYLGSLSDQISDDAKYWLVAGAVAGGGLTVIANAPNPAGASLLEKGFTDETISASGLLAGALLPTAIAAAAFGLL
ncbi:putative Na+/H+ antiporter [Lysobacter soli]|uniref:putative Na+/H+ antiporter n=1 Tax=Lysobacter soli TaxID=453783 RepID=UPI00240F9A72|nr:putative Na+/H+ antiporter [Lysobacter soli]MDG2519355.1 putative Na+/H+ antiporter [Lysobacter soli]